MSDSACSQPSAKHAHREAEARTPMSALTELDRRLALQGLRARIYVHDAMTAIMVNRAGDEDSTVDDDSAA